jgi:hypothetical protein
MIYNPILSLRTETRMHHMYNIPCTYRFVFNIKLEREADYSTPSSAEIKNAWSYTSTPKYTFIAWCSVKAQGQLYLLPSTFNIKTCRPANVI